MGRGKKVERKRKRRRETKTQREGEGEGEGERACPVKRTDKETVPSTIR